MSAGAVPFLMLVEPVRRSEDAARLATAHGPRARARHLWPWILSGALHAALVVVAVLQLSAPQARPPRLSMCLVNAATPTWQDDALAERDDATESDPRAETQPLEVPTPVEVSLLEEPLADEMPAVLVDASAEAEPEIAPEPLTRSSLETLPHPSREALLRRAPPPTRVAVSTTPTQPAGSVAASVPKPAPAGPAPRPARARAVVQARPYGSNLPPAYPAEAARRGIVGVVVLLISIDERGAVASVAVSASSGHAVLDDAAMAAVRTWRFAPALAEDGAPVAVVVRQRVGFAPPE